MYRKRKMAGSAVRLSPTTLTNSDGCGYWHKILRRSSRSTLHPGEGRSSPGDPGSHWQLMAAGGGRATFFTCAAPGKLCPCSSSVCAQAALVTLSRREHLHNSKTQHKIGGLVGRKGSVGEGCELARYLIYMYGLSKM